MLLNSVDKKFHLYGKFVILSSSYNDDPVKEWAKGSLNIVNRRIYITLFGVRNENVNSHKYVYQSSDIIKGYLLGGEYSVFCNDFKLIRSVEKKHYFVNRFLLHGLYISNLFLPDVHPMAINHGVGKFISFINIDQFHQWAFDPQNVTKLDNFLYKIGDINSHNHIYSIYIYYYKHHKQNIYYDKDEYHIKLCVKSKNKDISIVVDDLRRLLEIFMNRPLNINKISYHRHKGNNSSKMYITYYLPSNQTIFNNEYFDYLKEPLSFIHLKSYNNLNNITENFMTEFVKLGSILDAFFYSFHNRNVSYETSFVKYVTALDTYYKNACYSNGTKIGCLKNRIRLKFVKEFPINIRKLILGKRDSKLIHFGIHLLINTRTYFIHGIRHKHILSGDNLKKVTNELYWLFYYLILHKIGVPEKLIKEFIKENIK